MKIKYKVDTVLFRSEYTVFFISQFKKIMKYLRGGTTLHTYIFIRLKLNIMAMKCKSVLLKAEN